MGSILYVGKKAPSPRFRINPYVKTDDKTGKIVIDKEMGRTIETLRHMLNGKFKSDDVLSRLFDTEDEIKD